MENSNYTKFDPDTSGIKMAFDPNQPIERSYKGGYRKGKKKKWVSWCAPEHARIAATMEKDFPRDERGYKIRGSEKCLVLDPRPAILVPPRPTRPAPPLDERDTRILSRRY